MADFTVLAVAGLDVVAWDDPGTADDPTRLSPRPGLPERRYRAFTGRTVQLEAVVDDVHAPPDVDLDGRLFSFDLVEGVVAPFYFPTQDATSSVIRLRFDWCGHYAIAVRRTGGGAEIIPIDVENEP